MKKQTKFDLCNHFNEDWKVQSIYFPEVELWITLTEMVDESGIFLEVRNVKHFEITQLGYINHEAYDRMKPKSYVYRYGEDLKEFEESIKLVGLKPLISKFIRRIQKKTKEKPLSSSD